MSDALKARIADVFNEPGCDKNQAKDAKERKKGCSKPLTPGRRGRRLRLRRRQDRAAADHRRRAPGPRPARLRGQWLGQPPRRLVRSRTCGARLHHRPDRNGHRHGQRREAAVSRHQGIDRPAYARRRCSSMPPACTALIGDDIEAVCRHASEKLRHALHPGQCAGLRRLQEPRQQAGRRGAARPCHRHASSRTTSARPTSTSSASSTSSGEFWHGEAAARAARHPRPRLRHRRCALPRHRRRAHARAST